MKLASKLAPIALEDSASGEMIRLGTLWKDQTAILVFLRHFG